LHIVFHTQIQSCLFDICKIACFLQQIKVRIDNLRLAYKASASKLASIPCLRIASWYTRIGYFLPP
jgi:hypothetical protein